MIISSLEGHRAQAWQILNEEKGQPDWPGARAWTEALVLQEAQEAQALGALVGKELAAFILYRRSQAGVEVSLLATARRFRRQGLMSQLLSQLAKTLPIGQELWLEVHEQNVEAQMFYESLGLFIGGRRESYYSDGGAALLYNYKRLP